jgi:hypothetical protein
MEPSFPYSKLFTIDEANALLPRVRPLIEKILDMIGRLRAKSETVIRAEKIDPETPDLMRRLRQNEEISGFLEQINESVNEIQQYGCICKGVEQGLLDFPCVLGKDIVFLCWQYDEAGIAFWHRIEDGYAGRRPLLDPGDTKTGGAGPLH